MQQDDQAQQIHNNNLQIGWMKFQDNLGTNPVFESFHINEQPQAKGNANNIRAWARYFAPSMGAVNQVVVPNEWSQFFTSHLLSPMHFEWARKFLQTEAISVLKRNAGTGSSFIFALPAKCPIEQAPDCLLKLRITLMKNSQKHITQWGTTMHKIQEMSPHSTPPGPQFSRTSHQVQPRYT